MVLLHLENNTFHKGRENAKMVSVVEQPQEKKDFEENQKTIFVSCYYSCPYNTLSKKDHREETQK